MKKFLKLSLAASIVLAANAVAETKLGEKTVLSGDVRAVYYAEDEGSGTESASSIGFNPTITKDCLFTDKLKWELGAGVALHVSESADGKSSEYSMTRSPESGDSSENHATLTKLNGTYDYGSGFVKIGYQLLDTPMAESDDIRTIPNSYFAGVVAYGGIKNTTLLAVQVTHMAGMVDSQAEEAQNYHSMSDAALVMYDDNGSVVLGNNDIDDKVVNALAVMYADEDAGLNGQLWYYSMADAGISIGTDKLGAVSAMYFDAGMAFGPATVTAQYMTFATSLWSNTAMGLMAEVEMGDFAVTAAMNSYTFSDDGIGGMMAPAWYAWGGYPEFVAGEEVDASFADWDGGSSYMVGAGYGGVENLGLSATYLSYSDAVNAVDAVAEYSFSEQVSGILIYETKMFDDSTVDDITTTEVKAFYTF